MLKPWRRLTAPTRKVDVLIVQEATYRMWSITIFFVYFLVIKGARYITATWRLVGILYGSLDDELNAVEELDEHREATKCEGVGVSKAHIRVSTERSPLSLSKRDENAGGSSDLMEDNVNNCRTQKCRLELLSDWLSSTNTETVAVALDALDSSSSSSTTNEVHRDSETQLPCEALRRLKRAFYFLMCNDVRLNVREKKVLCLVQRFVAIVEERGQRAFRVRMRPEPVA